MPTLKQLKEAFGERYSRVKVNADTRLHTDETQKGDLTLVTPALPKKQKKVKFSK